MIGSIGCMGRPTRRMVDSRSRFTASVTSNLRGCIDRGRPSRRPSACRSCARRPCSRRRTGLPSPRSLIRAKRAGGRQHVVEPARRDPGHVLPRPPRGRVGDQELARAGVEVVDEQRGLPGLGDRLRGPGPDADHVRRDSPRLRVSLSSEIRRRAASALWTVAGRNSTSGQPLDQLARSARASVPRSRS